MLTSRLKALREEKGYSKRKVASDFNIAESTYGKWELGHRSPELDTVMKLAEYYEVSTDYLLGSTDDPTPPREKKEVPPSSDRETLKEALIKAGIIPVDRDLTDAEYALLFGAAKGLFESLDK